MLHDSLVKRDSARELEVTHDEHHEHCVSIFFIIVSVLTAAPSLPDFWEGANSGLR